MRDIALGRKGTCGTNSLAQQPLHLGTEAEEVVDRGSEEREAGWGAHSYTDCRESLGTERSTRRPWM